MDRADADLPRRGSPACWFSNRATGPITVVQMPNLALVVFAAAVVAGHVLQGRELASRVLGDLADGAIVAWSVDELVRGVNPWRRLLGGLVLGGSLVSLVRR